MSIGVFMAVLTSSIVVSLAHMFRGQYLRELALNKDNYACKVVKDKKILTSYTINRM